MRTLLHTSAPMLALVVAMWCIYSTTHAQNLVPNGSFEEYSQCPEFLNQISRAAGWVSYRETPDYFNACASEFLVDAPLNIAGFQEASHGSAYAGLLTWRGDAGETREHIGISLIEALVPESPVYLSFRMVAAVGRPYPVDGILVNASWTCDKVGLRFAMSPSFQTGDQELPNSAALFSAIAPLDTTDWVTVSGYYVPDSAYSHILVGGFFDDASVAPVNFNPDGIVDAAYVLVDEICVGLGPQDCTFNTGMRDNDLVGFNATPNPASYGVTVSFTRPLASPVQFVVLALSGSSVWSGLLHVGSTGFEIPANALYPGTFLIHGQGAHFRNRPHRFVHL